MGAAAIRTTEKRSYIEVAADGLPSQVMPTVVKLFASQDRALRVQLLQNMEFFVEHMDADVLDQQVSYPPARSRPHMLW